MNEQLKELYKNKLEKFDTLFTDKEKAQLSKPFLLKTYKNFDARGKKIMIFGQEPHIWGKLYEFEYKQIDELMEKYEKLLNNRILFKNKLKGRSCFLQRLIKVKNNLKEDSIQIIWNNLLKFNKNGKSAKKNEKVINLSIELVRKEIEILKPDFFLFQTGPHYDFLIKKLFSDNIEDSKVIVKKRLWKFKVDDKLALRINHPCTRRFKIKPYYYKAISEIKKYK